MDSQLPAVSREKEECGDVRTLFPRSPCSSRTRAMVKCHDPGPENDLPVPVASAPVRW